MSDLKIDALNFNPATQKPDGKDARDREAVEAALNHEQRCTGEKSK